MKKILKCIKIYNIDKDSGYLFTYSDGTNDVWITDKKIFDNYCVDKIIAFRDCGFLIIPGLYYGVLMSSDITEDFIKQVKESYEGVSSSG